MLSQSASPHTRLGILQFLSCWCADSKHACQVTIRNILAMELRTARPAVIFRIVQSPPSRRKTCFNSSTFD